MNGWPRNLDLVCNIGYLLKFCQDCSNDDLGLTLTFFYGKVKYGKMLEHKISWKFLKFLIYSCLNENMKICENKRSRSLFDL